MSKDAEISKLVNSGVKSIYSQGERIEIQSADDIIKLENHNAKKNRAKFRPSHIRIGRV